MLPDEKDSNGNWKRSSVVSGKQQRHKAFSVWNAMRYRCIEGGNLQKKYPTYVGCYLSEKFKDYQYFANWYTNQVGYDLPGYSLDKDLLVHGNKCYGEEYCVLIPQPLNMFLVAADKIRGQYPQGICWCKTKSMLHVSIKIEGKTTNLGYFDSVDNARKCYKSAKEAEARRWYNRLRSGEFLADQKVIDRLEFWDFIEVTK